MIGLVIPIVLMMPVDGMNIEQGNIFEVSEKFSTFFFSAFFDICTK